MTETCRLTGCEQEATGRVRVRLPKRQDAFTEIAESAREHDIGLCADHLAAVSTGKGTYFFDDPVVGHVGFASEGVSPHGTEHEEST